MTIRLRYGHRWLEAESPPELTWRSAGPAAGETPVPSDHWTIDRLVARMESPVAGPPLSERAATAGRILLAVPDRTRPAALDRLLPAIFAVLSRARPDPAEVTIIVAGGTHAPGELDAITRLVPPPWLERVRLVAHDARDEAALVRAGTTSAGTPVRWSRHLEAADLVVAVGGIGYHYFAGFSGGRKTIFPGLGGYDSVQANHRLVLDPEPGGGLHPACRPGNLDRTPVHRDLLEAVGFLEPPVFAVNALINPDGALEGVFTGELVDSHTLACESYRSRHRRRLSEPVDVLVADAGGHPRDIDLVQTHKALVHLAPGVRDGGVVLLAARCPEGIGSPTMRQWFGYPDSAAMEVGLRTHYTLNSHTALSFRRITDRVRVVMITELTPDDLAGTGVDRARSLGDGLAMVRALHPGPHTACLLGSPQTTLLEVG